MSLTVLHSAVVEPEHRFEWWRELISQDVAPTRITTDHAEDFPATAGVARLGAVRLTVMSFPAIRSERTPALIRYSDPEDYQLTLIRGTEMWITQDRNEARMAAGDLVLWSTSLPFDGRGLAGSHGGISKAIILHLPRIGLPLPTAKVDRLLANAVPGRTGMAGILARHLLSVAEDAARLEESAAARVGIATWELATAFLGDWADARDRVPPESGDRMRLARIDAFIDANLCDPRLTPAAIAAHHHLSVRTLHWLFRHREETVAATIRHRRLARCRADLVADRYAAVPIHTIAARWGFTSAAAFSRVFRREYGISPREFRSMAGGAGGEGEE
ncbi:helix-turn-helix domain-containing protein [Streptomyces sp. NPDC053474]|uniref:AraC-like ligand-binding domain-containing protein n=1 Tax=Streptomyces sp. NPDC053474 TaxID=3365704 RepID=UPI0037D83D91